MLHTLCQCIRCANAPDRHRRRERIRAGACPVAGANALGLVRYLLITHTCTVPGYLHVASAVPMPQLAVDDDWEYVPVHVLLSAPMRRDISGISE